MRILLVEDDTILGNATSAYLRNNGYALDWVQDGKQADLALYDDAYEVVILDLGLPEMDGLSVLKRLRARKIETSVIILTARSRFSTLKPSISGKPRSRITTS